jgi:phage I-like protein
VTESSPEYLCELARVLTETAKQLCEEAHELRRRAEEISRKGSAARLVSQDLQRRAPDELIERLKSQSATAKQTRTDAQQQTETAFGMRNSAKRASASAERMTKRANVANNPKTNKGPGQ